jgi:hypothetical protein
MLLTTISKQSIYDLFSYKEIPNNLVLTVLQSALFISYYSDPETKLDIKITEDYIEVRGRCYNPPTTKQLVNNLVTPLDKIEQSYSLGLLSSSSNESIRIGTHSKGIKREYLLSTLLSEIIGQFHLLLEEEVEEEENYIYLSIFREDLSLDYLRYFNEDKINLIIELDESSTESILNNNIFRISNIVLTPPVVEDKNDIHYAINTYGNYLCGEIYAFNPPSDNLKGLGLMVGNHFVTNITSIVGPHQIPVISLKKKTPSQYVLYTHFFPIYNEHIGIKKAMGSRNNYKHLPELIEKIKEGRRLDVLASLVYIPCLNRQVNKKINSLIANSPNPIHNLKVNHYIRHYRLGKPLLNLMHNLISVYYRAEEALIYNNYIHTVYLVPPGYYINWTPELMCKYELERFVYLGIYLDKTHPKVIEAFRQSKWPVIELQPPHELLKPV